MSHRIRLFPMGIIICSLLLFGVLILGPGDQALAGSQPFGKLVDPDLEKRFDDQDRVKVIALLKGFRPLAGASLRNSPERAASFGQALTQARAKVLAELGPDQAVPGASPANLPLLALEVTAQGLARLQGSALVEAVQEDRLLELQTRQGLELIRSEPLRSLYGGQGVSVALIDSGADYTHPALGGTSLGYGTFPNAKVIGGYDFGEDDPDPMDNDGHGTTVTALAGGLDTQVGDYIGGVAPQAGLYVLKVTQTNGSILTSDLVAAWDWVLTHQHDDPDRPIMIVSVSLGTPGFQSDQYCDELNPAESLATAALVQAGIAVFVSSGNDGVCDGVSFPACLKNTIAVGSVYDAALGTQPGPDQVYCINADSCIGIPTSGCTYGAYCQDQATVADQIPCYSNSGRLLDLLAPANCSYVPTKNGYLSCFYGTSGSCAMAAGAAAVVQGYAKMALKRFLSVAELKATLAGGGKRIDDPKSDRESSRVDVQGAADWLK